MLSDGLHLVIDQNVEREAAPGKLRPQWCLSVETVQVAGLAVAGPLQLQVQLIWEERRREERDLVCLILLVGMFL